MFLRDNEIEVHFKVSHHPPLVSISFRLSPARPKDTRENILATKEFTVNIISEHFVEAANSASTEAPADVNEWVVSGLTMSPSVSITFNTPDQRFYREVIDRCKACICQGKRSQL